MLHQGADLARDQRLDLQDEFGEDDHERLIP